MWFLTKYSMTFYSTYKFSSLSVCDGLSQCSILRMGNDVSTVSSTLVSFMPESLKLFCISPREEKH